MRSGGRQPLSDRFEQGIRESARRSGNAPRACGDTGPTAPCDAGPAGLEGAHQFHILAAREMIKAACAPIGCRRNTQVGTMNMPMGINIEIGLLEVRTQQVGMLTVGGPVLNPYGPTHRVCLQRELFSEPARRHQGVGVREREPSGASGEQVLGSGCTRRTHIARLNGQHRGAGLRPEHGRVISAGVRYDHQLDGFGDESSISSSLKNAVDAFHEDVLFIVCRNHDADHVLVGDLCEASGRISRRFDPPESEEGVNRRRPSTPGSLRSCMRTTSSPRIQPLAGLRAPRIISVNQPDSRAS